MKVYTVPVHRICECVLDVKSRECSISVHATFILFFWKLYGIQLATAILSNHPQIYYPGLRHKWNFNLKCRYHWIFTSTKFTSLRIWFVRLCAINYCAVKVSEETSMKICKYKNIRWSNIAASCKKSIEHLRYFHHSVFIQFSCWLYSVNFFRTYWYAAHHGQLPSKRLINKVI